MLTIRLRRIGKRRHATFRFVVMEKSRSPQSRAVEFVGSYDPHADPPTVNLKRDRVEHWLKVGAQPSETVHNILVDAGLVTGPKVKVAKPKKKEAPAEPSAAAAPAAPEAKTEEKKEEKTEVKAEAKTEASAEAK
ncbi:MAG: 30S ribosomal protein S16 [Candidatus Kerfeldbacteria bacterium]|nr:30S ribosomal protein S16 [Candidatus Kerfeldbacteria bacterium]